MYRKWLISGNKLESSSIKHSFLSAKKPYYTHVELSRENFAETKAHANDTADLSSYERGKVEANGLAPRYV